MVPITVVTVSILILPPRTAGLILRVCFMMAFRIRTLLSALLLAFAIGSCTMSQAQPITLNPSSE